VPKNPNFQIRLLPFKIVDTHYPKAGIRSRDFPSTSPEDLWSILLQWLWFTGSFVVKIRCYVLESLLRYCCPNDNAVFIPSAPGRSPSFLPLPNQRFRLHDPAGKGTEWVGRFAGNTGCWGDGTGLVDIRTARRTELHGYRKYHARSDIVACIVKFSADSDGVMELHVVLNNDDVSIDRGVCW